MNVCISICSVCFSACLMLSGTSLLSGTRTVESYVDLVVAKALLHLVEQTAVGQLTERGQVVIGSWRHQLHLRAMQGENVNQLTSAA